MALNADVQVLTQPGSTGNQTYSLASNFDPKAIILWAVPLTANGTAAHYSFGMGFATYRGSAVQQRYVCLRGLDASATADTARGTGSDAALVLMTSGAGLSSRDLEIDLVSMQGGATSQVVLNWVNLHTTASIRVFMLVLGGSDITDALAGNFLLPNATTQNVTVTSGFGQPDLLFMASQGGPDATDAAANAYLGFGIGKKGEAGRSSSFMQVDGDTNSLTAMRQRSDHILCNSATSAVSEVMAALDTTVANWPTDGFRVLYDATPLDLNDSVSYLALRTTAQVANGANTCSIGGSLTQDNDCGFPPKVGIVFGWNLAASTSIQETAADQCGFGIGMYDGATSAWAGFTEDDALGTMDSNNQQSTLRTLLNYSPASSSLSGANAGFSGNNLQMVWTNTDVVAREYHWMALGDAGAAVGPPMPPLNRRHMHLLRR